MTNGQRAAASTNRQEAEEKFLDAAERLLVRVGHAGVTTRALAAEAGANQGLVHYYFGSLEEVLLRVLNRFTERLIARQRAMYSADVPFLEKWRTAWRFQEEDLAAGYPKIWFELQALAWNRPELSERIAAVNGEWREVLREAFGRALREYGKEKELPLEAVTAMVMTFALGYMLERLSGIREGHEELLAWVDGWIESLERGKRDGPRKSKRARKVVRKRDRR
ncbi:MAG TPA: TetR/AcrR family transcriptional regulator [Myxococcaceae bacterium]